MVLARRDQLAPYGPDNCYWRPARSEHEAVMGSEDIGIPDEPLELPMSAADKRKRAGLASDDERRMFDIWHRMLWRAGATKETD